MLQIAGLGLRAKPTTLPPTLSFNATGDGDAGEEVLMWGGAGGGLGLNEGPLPQSLPRPPGSLALLGPRGGVLWLANTYGQVCGLWVRMCSCVCVCFVWCAVAGQHIWSGVWAGDEDVLLRALWHGG